MTISRVYQLMSVAAVSLAIGACQTGGHSCDGCRPLRPTQAEIRTMSDAQVKATLEHNEFGRRVCGWRPN